MISTLKKQICKQDYNILQHCHLSSICTTALNFQAVNYLQTSKF